MQKIIYFTAGQMPTVAEQAAIDAVVALDQGLEAPYALAIRGPGGNYERGTIEAADFVMGTLPAAYVGHTVFDPANPPEPTLPDTKTIIAHGEAVTGVAPTGTYVNTVTFSVAGGVITAITLS